MDGLENIPGMRSTDARALVEEILSYEKACGIGPEESTVPDIVAADDGNAAEELARRGRACADWNRFVREIDLCAQHRLGEFSSLRVRFDTPAVLRDLGLADHPMNHTQKHVRNELHPEDGTVPPKGGNYHGIPLHTLRSLPELLEHPWAVWDTKPGASGIAVCLSDVDWKGDPLVCFVETEATCHDDGRANNFVKTVFGRGSLGADATEAKEVGRLLYVDPEELKGFLEKGKLSAWAKEKLVSSPCIHYAQAFTSRHILHPCRKLVKPLDAKSDPYFEAQSAWDAEKQVSMQNISGFKRQIEAWSRRELAPGRAFTVCDSVPEALEGIGMPDLPLMLPRRQFALEAGAIRIDADKACSSLDALLALPRGLVKPIAAWDSRPGRRDVHVALALQDEAGSVLVAKILPDAVDMASGRAANLIRSVHGHSRIDQEIEEASATGRLLYADPHAAAPLPLSRRPIVPGSSSGPLIHKSLKPCFTPREDDPYLAAQQAWDEAHPKNRGRSASQSQEAAREGARRGAQRPGEDWGRGSVNRPRCDDSRHGGADGAYRPGSWRA